MQTHLFTSIELMNPKSYFVPVFRIFSFFMRVYRKTLHVIMFRIMTGVAVTFVLTREAFPCWQWLSYNWSIQGHSGSIWVSKTFNVNIKNCLGLGQVRIHMLPRTVGQAHKQTSICRLRYGKKTPCMHFIPQHLQDIYLQVKINLKNVSHTLVSQMAILPYKAQ